MTVLCARRRVLLHGAGSRKKGRGRRSSDESAEARCDLRPARPAGSRSGPAARRERVEQNAGKVARHIDSLVRAHRAREVMVAGEVRACALLREQLASPYVQRSALVRVALKLGMTDEVTQAAG
jgi:hypothetical protein